jgi:hypothetical protein
MQGGVYPWFKKLEILVPLFFIAENRKTPGKSQFLTSE